MIKLTRFVFQIFSKDRNNVVYATCDHDYQQMKIMMLKYSSVVKEGRIPIYREQIINYHSRDKETPKHAKFSTSFK